MRSVTRALILLVGVCACGQYLLAQKINTYVGSAADFKSYKTYYWIPGRARTTQGVNDNPAVTPVVQAAVDPELAARGLRKVDSGGDLEVTFGVAQRMSFQVESVGGWIVWGMSSIWVPGFSRTNNGATLAVNMVDAKVRKSAFLAICQDTVDDPSQVERKVQRAVGKAFKKYPVPKQAK